MTSDRAAAAAIPPSGDGKAKQITQDDLMEGMTAFMNMFNLNEEEDIK